MSLARKIYYVCMYVCKFDTIVPYAPDDPFQKRGRHVYLEGKLGLDSLAPNVVHFSGYIHVPGSHFLAGFYVSMLRRTPLMTQYIILVKH